MYEFQLWYVNFDAIFTKKQLVPPQIILQTLPYHSSQKQNWPRLFAAPKIGQCFQLVESFIKNNNNWFVSQMPDETLKHIEERINDIMILISAQKQYALQFWGVQIRRIQASICHFLIIFQNFMSCLITAPHKTLKSCELNGALLTKLSLIQQLVNNILQNLQNLTNFLCKKQFRQEKQISKQFCSIFRNLVENLPNMTSSQLCRIPKLMQFIHINNPIQIAQHLMQDSKILKNKKNRPKAETVGGNFQLFKEFSLTDKRFKNIFVYENRFIERNPRRKTCTGRLQKKLSDQSPEKFIIFKFPEKQVRFSFTNIRNNFNPIKKNTYTTMAGDQKPRSRRSSLSQNKKYFTNGKAQQNVKSNAKNQSNDNNDNENFFISVRVPKKKAQQNIRDKSTTQISEKFSKKSKKSRQRSIIKKLIESQQEVKRQNKQKAKDAAFTLVKNLWSQIKFNQFAKKQPIQLDKGGQKRPIWAPQGYEQNKQDDLKQKIQDILYEDSQDQQQHGYNFPD